MPKIILALLTLEFFTCAAKCPPDYTIARNSLISVYDYNQDGCISDPADVPARDAIAKARGVPIAFNGWRGALGQGCP